MNNAILNPILIGKRVQPLLVAISGPSGVGKDSILMRMRELGLLFHFAMTIMSQPNRPGEWCGHNYHFVTREQFEGMIVREELLEWTDVYGQYKGISKNEVRQALAAGQDIILRMDVQDLAAIKRLAPEAVLIFIAPGSFDELRIRLQVRYMSSPDEIERRLTLARNEMEALDAFDYVVINHKDHPDTAVGQICAIITAEKQRVRPRHLSL